MSSNNNDSDTQYLSLAEAVLGCEAIELGGLGVVLRHADAIAVHLAEIELHGASSSSVNGDDAMDIDGCICWMRGGVPAIESRH